MKLHTVVNFNNISPLFTHKILIHYNPMSCEYSISVFSGRSKSIYYLTSPIRGKELLIDVGQSYSKMLKFVRAHLTNK